MPIARSSRKFVPSILDFVEGGELEKLTLVVDRWRLHGNLVDLRLADPGVIGKHFGRLVGQFRDTSDVTRRAGGSWARKSSRMKSISRVP